MRFYQLILEKIKLNTGIDSINETPAEGNGMLNLKKHLIFIHIAKLKKYKQRCGYYWNQLEFEVGATFQTCLQCKDIICSLFDTLELTQLNNNYSNKPEQAEGSKLNF